MWRQGDVFIQSCPSLPKDAEEQRHCVLAAGELTGHAHRVAEPGAALLYRHSGVQYLRVLAPRATIVHEEHGPVLLERGVYRVWIQREYTPQEIRRVVD